MWFELNCILSFALNVKLSVFYINLRTAVWFTKTRNYHVSTKMKYRTTNPANVTKIKTTTRYMQNSNGISTEYAQIEIPNRTI